MEINNLNGYDNEYDENNDEMNTNQDLNPEALYNNDFIIQNEINLLRANSSELIDYIGLSYYLINDYTDEEIFQSLEDVKVGLKNINNYCKVVKSSDNFKCMICLDEIKPNTDINKMICNHEYCIDCSNKWFKDNVKCPICNLDLRDVKSN